MHRSVQVSLEDSEIQEIQEIARRKQMSVDEWIHRTLQEARRSQAPRSVEEKLRAVQAAAKYEFPTGDIDQMLSEIEQGYRFDRPA